MRSLSSSVGKFLMNTAVITYRNCIYLFFFRRNFLVLMVCKEELSKQDFGDPNCFYSFVSLLPLPTARRTPGSEIYLVSTALLWPWVERKDKSWCRTTTDIYVVRYVCAWRGCRPITVVMVCVATKARGQAQVWPLNQTWIVLRKQASQTSILIHIFFQNFSNKQDKRI